MKHLAIPGGWEGDARPDGGYVVAVNGGRSLTTHLGAVGKPTGDPFRYPRITPVGPLKIVGYDSRVREWTPDDGWRDVSAVPAAITPAIYDRDGVMHLIDRTKHDSASGWLYVATDGAPILVEQRPWDKNGLDLHDWIVLGGWIVGTGHEGGCWLRTPEGAYLAIVPPGAASPFIDAMFIRATIDGDNVAVCYYDRRTTTAHLFWFTLSEARGVFPVHAKPRPAWQDDPPARVPTFAPADFPIAVHVFGGSGFRMNLGPAHDDLTAAPMGSFVTLARDPMAEALDYARQHDVSLYAYVDDVSYPPSWVPAFDGVDVVPAVQAYPYRDKSGVLRPLEETVGMIDATLAAMNRDNPFRGLSVVMAFYRQIDGDGRYNWPLQHVLDLQAAVWELCRKRHATSILVFHQNRANGADGVDSRPEFVESLKRLRAAADVPWPDEPDEEEPTPDEPELDTPLPNKPEPELPAEPDAPEPTPEPETPIPPPVVTPAPPRKRQGGLLRELGRINFRKLFKGWFR